MAQSMELNLRDYLRILQKRYKVIVGLAVLCTLSTLLLTPETKPAWEADATVKITHQSTVASLFLDSVTWTAGDDLQTQSKIIASLPMALKVGQALEMFPEELTAADLSQNEALSSQVASFKALYKAAPVSGTGLIKITVTTPRPDYAVQLANTVADVFIQEQTYQRNRQIIESRRFIEEQLASYQDRLRTSEAVLTDFKKEHLTSLSLSENEMARLNELIEEDSQRIRALENLVANLNARLMSPEMTYVDLIRGGDEDRALEELNSELVRLQMERERLLVLQVSSSPEIAAVESQVQGLARRLLEGYRKTLDFLVSRRDGLEAKLAALPENDAQAARLARDVKVNEDIYTLLQQRYQEALIKEAEKIQEVSVVEYAAEAARHAVPGRSVRGLAGLLVGLLLGLLAAFVQETLDTSIDTIEDVESYLNVPVVGMVPQFNLEDCVEAVVRQQPWMAETPHLKEYASVIARHDRRSAASEAYRTLRTNLQFTAMRHGKGTPGEDSGQIFLFTSSSPGEGKSTTVVNLAVTMAQMGKRVLLMECDLRNPHINRFFGASRSPGLTDVMLGTVSIGEAVRSGADLAVSGGDLGGLATEGLDRLHLLTSGTLPPQPAEILISQRFGELLESLRSRFDVILLDSPPVLPVTDAAILGTKVDGVIIVYQLGRVSRNMLRRAKILLENVHAPIWGIVLNGLRANLTGYAIDSYYGRTESARAEEDASVLVHQASRREASWFSTVRRFFSGFGSNGRHGDTTREDAPPLSGA